MLASGAFLHLRLIRSRVEQQKAVYCRLTAMISPTEAASAIAAHVVALPSEIVPLEQAAGRVLREDIVATRDQPPFDRVTMDGIAFSTRAYAAGRRRFVVCGTQAAGSAPCTLSDPEGCIEVMTGAVLPDGCDCVVPFEKLSLQSGIAELAEGITPAPGLNVHSRGRDVRKGDLLLKSGTRVGPTEIAVLAANGTAHVSVAQQPRIVVVSTGDELVEPGQPLAPWQIYRSNAYALLASLTRRGYTNVRVDHLMDDREALRTRLRAHLESCEVLLLSGGVSMGRFDYVPEVLEELGVRRIFHKIAQRPGKPMWFGIGPKGQSVFGLPGNPVSTLMCLARYVYGGLEVAAGVVQRDHVQTVVMDEDFEVKPALAYFLPVARHGAARASPRPTQGSGDFTSLLGTDGFVELPPGPALVTRGTEVPFYEW